MITLDQWYNFSTDLATLRTKGALHPTSALAPLQPFIAIDGVLRMGGRLHKGPISATSKHKIELHSDSAVTRSLIRQCHRDLAHASAERTIHALREKYYLLRFRAVVRSVLENVLTADALRPIGHTIDVFFLPTVCSRSNRRLP